MSQHVNSKKNKFQCIILINKQKISLEENFFYRDILE